MQSHDLTHTQCNIQWHTISHLLLQAITCFKTNTLLTSTHFNNICLMLHSNIHYIASSVTRNHALQHIYRYTQSRALTNIPFHAITRFNIYRYTQLHNLTGIMSHKITRFNTYTVTLFRYIQYHNIIIKDLNMLLEICLYCLYLYILEQSLSRSNSRFFFPHLPNFVNWGGYQI